MNKGGLHALVAAVLFGASTPFAKLLVGTTFIIDTGIDHGMPSPALLSA